MESKDTYASLLFFYWKILDEFYDYSRKVKRAKWEMNVRIGINQKSKSLVKSITRLLL